MTAAAFPSGSLAVTEFSGYRTRTYFNGYHLTYEWSLVVQAEGLRVEHRHLVAEGMGHDVVELAGSPVWVVTYDDDPDGRTFQAAETRAQALASYEGALAQQRASAGR